MSCFTIFWIRILPEYYRYFKFYPLFWPFGDNIKLRYGLQKVSQFDGTQTWKVTDKVYSTLGFDFVIFHLRSFLLIYFELNFFIIVILYEIHKWQKINGLTYQAKNIDFMCELYRVMSSECQKIVKKYI